jgi:pyruvate dehydrogenase E2 component (dihydrolipoamide acetyltransferase)
MSEFRMPTLGADMDAGTILEWKVVPGATVHRGDIMALVQTDKADIDVETFDDGVVASLVVPEGTRVPVGTVLATLAPPGATPKPESHRPTRRPRRARRSRPKTGPSVLSPLVRRLADELGVDLTKVAGSGPGGEIRRHDVEAAATHAPERRPVETERQPAPGARVSPRARKLAATLGIDTGALTGSGPGGAITGDDVERAAAAKRAEPTEAATPVEAAAAGRAEPTEAATPGEAAPIDRAVAMRRAIAALMERSHREIPHYHLVSRIDLRSAMTWLAVENEHRTVTERLLPAALLAAATARAAQRYPDLNGHWLDGQFRPAATVDLGVAVSLRHGGLLVPVIRDAANRPLPEIMTALRDLVTRARSGRLRASDLANPSITITNLGDKGVEAVFGIIYPPQVALVGFGRIADEPWAEDGMVGVRPVVWATLAADHRASDGHRGGLLLGALADLLQKPEKL